MLSADLRYTEILKRTYPLVKEHSFDIGMKTYENMFSESNEIKKLFKNTTPEQVQRLVETIIFYCKEVDNFSLIYNKLDKIAHMHVQNRVNNECYTIMEKAFIKAMCETMNLDENDELISAWKAGMNRLSQELIHIENLIRRYAFKENVFDVEVLNYS